jgi:hypothetical protein
MVDENKAIIVENLNEIFAEVSKTVAERDVFLLENAETLAKWQGLEQEVNVKKFWANEKVDMLVSEGKVILEGGEFMQDEHIEMKVRATKAEIDSTEPLFALDFFEKVRYNKGKN